MKLGAGKLFVRAIGTDGQPLGDWVPVMGDVIELEILPEGTQTVQAEGTLTPVPRVRKTAQWKQPQYGQRRR